MFSNKLMCVLPLAALALPACAQQSAATPAAPTQAAPTQADPRPAQSAPAQSGPAGAQQGMVVVRDADTGELRAPTALEARALHPRAGASAAAAAAPAPKMVTGPGGRRSVQLGERHMVYSVVTRGADGKLEEQCVHGRHAAEHALEEAPRQDAAKPEEQRQ